MQLQAYRIIYCFLIGLSIAGISFKVRAQNPVIRSQFTADPSARVFNGRIYLYPSHDIKCGNGQGRADWFCMEDYHVFSSPNLVNWKDHGMIISQGNVPWADGTAYSMWAPDCIFKNGKYYFYFPTRAKDTVNYKGFAIGVAISDHPEGPFIPEPKAIENVHGIDPNVFIDTDGQAYLYWAQGELYAAKLKDNMLELASPPYRLKDLPAKGLKEGPYLFSRNGIYYLTYPHVEHNTERLEYAISDNPLGPFKVTGVMMDESASGCWTNHQSVMEWNNQWFLFYHDNDLSPGFDKNRSSRIDSLFFNSDGTIRKVAPTLRGVGVTAARSDIQVDRYSGISNQGIRIAFNDSTNASRGWKTIFTAKESWIRYNSVDFGKEALQSVNLRLRSDKNTVIQLKLDNTDGPVIANVAIAASTSWKTVTRPLSSFIPGKHDIIIQLKDDACTELDWISFQ